MDTSDEEIREKAEELYLFFETRTVNDKSFITLRDDTPDWARQVIFTAHDAMMPDDFRYQFIKDAVAAIADHPGRDAAREIIEDDQEIWNSTMSQWLSSHMSRWEYVDEILEERAMTRHVPKLFELLQHGMLREKLDTFELTWNALHETLERDKEAQDMLS